ncbi:MAG: class I SAM-dependent methyltransferase [Verrucomicrobiales bacterium]
MPSSPDRKKVLAFGRVPAFRRYELFMERYRSAAALIEAHLDLHPGSRILDVGAGHGLMKRFFGQNTGSWWGIEPWKERAERCRRLGYEIVDLDLDQSSLPFPDGHFDVVIGSHVIEHLEDSGAAVRDMGRVTKPGGLLMIATPTKPPLLAGVVQIYHRRRRSKSGDTQNAFTARSLRKHLVSNLGPDWDLLDCRGFRVLSARRQLPLENYRWFYRANLALARALPWMVPEVNVLLQKPIDS